MQKVDKSFVLLSFSASSSFCASPASFYSWRSTIWSINLVGKWKEDRLKKIDWSRSLTQCEKRLNDKSIFWSKKTVFDKKEDCLRVSHKSFRHTEKTRIFQNVYNIIQNSKIDISLE